MKHSGKRRAGNPHAPFDVAGTGDGPSGTAPVPDPTCEGWGCNAPAYSPVCGDLARVRLRGVCDRRLRAPDRRLARVGSLRTDFVLDALDQAIYERCRDDIGDLIHHSDRGTQYLAIRYTERLADAGIEPSVGSRGDSYDNALAESVIGLFKTEVIRRKGPWRHLEAVEFATLDWVDWFNTRRLLEPIGYVPPAEYEARYYEQAAVA